MRWYTYSNWWFQLDLFSLSMFVKWTRSRNKVCERTIIFQYSRRRDTFHWLQIFSINDRWRRREKNVIEQSTNTVYSRPNECLRAHKKANNFARLCKMLVKSQYNCLVIEMLMMFVAEKLFNSLFSCLKCRNRNTHIQISSLSTHRITIISTIKFATNITYFDNISKQFPWNWWKIWHRRHIHKQEHKINTYTYFLYKLSLNTNQLWFLLQCLLFTLAKNSKMNKIYNVINYMKLSECGKKAHTQTHITLREREWKAEKERKKKKTK